MVDERKIDISQKCATDWLDYYLRKGLIDGGEVVVVMVAECIGLMLRPTMSSCRESLFDLLPLDLLDLGMGSESFLLAGRWCEEGGGGGGGMLHQTSLSPAVRRVEQSEEMERSVTQLEWRVRGELIGDPVTASQT